MKTYLGMAALVAAATLTVAATPAFAGPVRVEMRFGAPYPPPAYVQRAPVYVNPQPFYVEQAPAYGYRDWGGWRQQQWHERQWREHQWRERQWREQQWREQRWHDHGDRGDRHGNRDHDRRGEGR
jgi:hypothetical protein